MSGHYRLSHCDHAQELDNVRMMELSVDGCLLQELDLVFLASSAVESFDGTLHRIVGTDVPSPFADLPKLT